MTLATNALSQPLSLEATCKTVDDVAAMASDLPSHTAVNIAWLDGQGSEERARVARQLAQSGLSPVPIVAARRITSRQHLFGLIEQMRAAGARKHFMLVGGDPSRPQGPFQTGFDLVHSNCLEQAGIERVTLPGFPESNPAAPGDDNAISVAAKAKVLKRRGIVAEITTQLALNPTRIFQWIQDLRGNEVEAVIRIGIPGPTPCGKIARYLKMFGIDDRDLKTATREQAGIMDFSPLWEKLYEGLAAEPHGDVGLHLYPFGGTAQALDWLKRCEQRHLGLRAKTSPQPM
jgi:methylenetetrahydrofolate reductase (NADPH)